MITLARARKLRELILKASEHLSDDEAYYGAELFPVWTPSTQYIKDERIRYGTKLYKVLQNHTSQSDWTPDKAVSLYVEIAEPGTIPEWKQPTGAHDAYMTGDKVRHNSKIWVSTMDYNTYEPGVYGWDETN